MLRRRTAAASLRHGVDPRPRASDPRRADPGHGRGRPAGLLDAIREDAAKGRTVLFATHYLEEADAYADRTVLIRSGEIVADGTTAEVKSLASGRTIRATLPGADDAALRSIPGVETVEVRGDVVLIRSSDTDQVAQYVLGETQARDLEITARGLEEAFLALTGDHGEDVDNASRPSGTAR